MGPKPIFRLLFMALRTARKSAQYQEFMRMRCGWCRERANVSRPDAARMTHQPMPTWQHMTHQHVRSQRPCGWGAESGRLPSTSLVPPLFLLMCGAVGVCAVGVHVGWGEGCTTCVLADILLVQLQACAYFGVHVTLSTHLPHGVVYQFDTSYNINALIMCANDM